MSQQRNVRWIGRVSAGLVAAIAVIGLGASAAGAHVVIHPGSEPKGASDVLLSLSAPNESTTGANVTQFEIDLPLDHPLLGTAPQTVAGWDAVVTSTKLTKPVTTDDGTITETVSKIVWTATGAGVPPSQFGLFTLLVGSLPSDTSSVQIKAVQTYSDGTVVSWIEPTVKGTPAPEHPVPVLTLTGKAPKK